MYNNQRNTYTNNTNYKNHNNGRKFNNNINREVEKITIPLSQKYSDKKELYLDDGIAYKLAEECSNIPPHQMRKILEQSKKAKTLVMADSNKFTEARDTLFYIVPMAAYNAGRDPKLKVLYNFIRSHINENALKSVKDIEVFDQLVTSIIAYHKLLSKK